MTYYIKKPCTHCPFRADVKPFLHPERAEQLAYSACNPYSEFFCHKTTEFDEISEDTCVGESSKLCAGFLSLMSNECGRVPEGFVPSDNCYESAYEMIEAYEQEWDNKH